MKKASKPSLRKVLLVLGISLLVIPAVVFLCWQWGIHSAQKKAETYVSTLRSLTPTPQSAPLEERRDNTMAVLPLEGVNFTGILEFPKYDSALPVCADWGKVSKYPCRLEGSVYDRSLKIGATSQKGQYDFYREISVGDQVCFTDLQGNRFAYQVTDIRYESHADEAALQKNDAALTLFIKNIYAFEYILIFCDPL